MIRPTPIAHCRNGRIAPKRVALTILVGAVSSQRVTQLVSILASGRVPTSRLTLLSSGRRADRVLGL